MNNDKKTGMCGSCGKHGCHDVRHIVAAARRADEEHLRLAIDSADADANEHDELVEETAKIVRLREIGERTGEYYVVDVCDVALMQVDPNPDSTDIALRSVDAARERARHLIWELVS